MAGSFAAFGIGADLRELQMCLTKSVGSINFYYNPNGSVFQVLFSRSLKSS